MIYLGNIYLWLFILILIICCRALNPSESDYKSFDVKFIIKDEGKSIMAHKAILSQRSPYFRAVRVALFLSFFSYSLTLTNDTQNDRCSVEEQKKGMNMK